MSLVPITEGGKVESYINTDRVIRIRGRGNQATDVFLAGEDAPLLIREQLSTVARMLGAAPGGAATVRPLGI